MAVLQLVVNDIISNKHILTMYHLLINIITVSLGCYATSQIYPEVETSLGNIRGIYETSYGNNTYMSFRGIRYAEPPTGDLRFKDPIEYSTYWYDTLVADDFGNACIQVYHTQGSPDIKLGDEDCLYINVYVPGNTIDPSNMLDVAVYIHGGAFMYGAADMAQPHFLMDSPVILVTFNYRLGVMGFLSTEDKNLPGNFGLKDQVVAMKWVQRHIESFGGNKDSVLLAGHSSGGASVHLHYLSPLSKGLFHSGISHSGCALNPWAFQQNPLEKARKVGHDVGCRQKSTKDLVDCLKTVPAMDFADTLDIFNPFQFQSFPPLGPVVDAVSPEPFLAQHPYNLLKKGEVYDVPWILGAATSEGLFPAAELILNDNYFRYLSTNWTKFAPVLMHYVDTISDSKMVEVANKIKEYYLAGEEISKDTFYYLIQMISDRLYVVDDEIAARMQANATNSEVFFYQFDFIGQTRYTLVDPSTNQPLRLGVAHGDDVQFIMSTKKDVDLHWMPKSDERMKDDLIQIWTSLVSMGYNRLITASTNINCGCLRKPMPNQWKPVRKHVSNPFRYMYVGRDGQFEMKQARELGHRSFWESIDFKENAKLFNN